MENLEKSILGAIVYVDIFEYPLTLIEIQKYLLNKKDFILEKHSLNDIDNLVSGSLADKISTKEGFYFLKGREKIVNTRKQRYIFAKHKYDKALRVTKFLSRLPFVRMISVCNSLSYSNTREESDIDLFVITAKGGVWWARFLSLLILKIFKMRPGQNGAKDKICLSFFVDEENLNLKNLQAGENDYYFSYWLSTLYPLYDSGGYYYQLMLSNKWLIEKLPQSVICQPHFTRTIKDKSGAKYLVEMFLISFSALIKKIQEKSFPGQIRELINKDTRVRVERGILKFHTTDRREQYAREFEKRYNKIISVGGRHT